MRESKDVMTAEAAIQIDLVGEQHYDGRVDANRQMMIKNKISGTLRLIIMDYTKFKIFLSALEQGLEVELKDHTYVMGFDSNNRPRLAHKLISTDSEGNEKEVFMQGLMLPDINNFIIDVMEQITDEQIAEIVANVTLNKNKQKED